MPDSVSVKAKVAAYLLMNKEIKEIKETQERLKLELEPYLQEAETNTRGSHVITFSEPLDIFGTRYAGLQKVRKVARVLNEERALAFLTSDQAFEAAVVTIQHVDHDGLWDLFANDMLTKEVYDSFFDDTVSWSFMPTKE